MQFDLKSADAVLSKLKEARLVFWDFDGVIKDSLSVKADAFFELFIDFGVEFADRVKQHHESNGGISRFEKIPQYLKWAGQVPTPDLVELYSNKFSLKVTESVINSPWVPGVREYLESHCKSQVFVMATATPENEVKEILGALNILSYFCECHGAPKQKKDVVREVLDRFKYAPSQAVFVGDEKTDYLAAQASNVPFILRKTELNKVFQEDYTGLYFYNLDN
jgi:phosphoglycolate phosphatase-like HAD superfamily hydrolase